MAQHQFTSVDYVVFSLTVLTSVAIGLFCAHSRRRQSTSTMSEEYLMAGRSMRSIPIALSLIASFLSAVSILGLPAEIFYFGVQYWMVVTATFVVIPVVVAVYLPVFYDLRLTSVYEYLQRRFSVSVRLIASAIYILQTVLYSAVVIYAPAIALDAVSNFPTWASILTGGAVATLYTTVGGMKAVIWTDVFQAVVMLGGLLTIIIMGTVHMGGLQVVFQKACDGSRLNFFNWSPNPTERLTFWALSIGGTFTSLQRWGVGQTSVQRMLTSHSLRSAKRSLWLMLPLTLLSITLCSLAGIVIYAVYADCDPLEACFIEKRDQILPYFVVDVLRHAYGIPGLFLSAVVCGTLSTISSNLNSVSAVTLEDFIRPRKRHMTEKAATVTSRSLALGYGVLVILLSFGFAKIQTSQLITASQSVFGATGGPLLGIFTLGMLSTRANNTGALLGLIMGLFFTSWITIGAEIFPNPKWKPLPNSTSGCNSSMNATVSKELSCSKASGSVPQYDRARDLYGVSFMWYGFIGFLVTFVTGYVMSLWLPGRKTTVDKSLLAPCLQSGKCSLFFWKTHDKSSAVQYVEMDDQEELPGVPMSDVSGLTDQFDDSALLEATSESEL